ncbi:MAG: amidohydrolase family protein [Fuerstiella sp.]|jgi:N-acetylglucosamine-6-phosphate deacetylase|nr:amidohydrolase family protein [Fuerstiella sp.]
MLTFIRLIVLLLVPAVSIAADQSSDQNVGLRKNVPSVWALQHATVVVRPGEVVNDMTVVVRDGKISSVTAAGTPPADARLVDLQGKTVYAGFIDAYSEVRLSADHLSRAARHWNTNVTPQLSVAEQPGGSSENEELRKQGVVAQLRAPSTGIVRGRSALVATGSGDPGHSILRGDVAQHLELTVAKRDKENYPGSPMGAVALARQAAYDAQWYRDVWNVANVHPELPRPEHNDALGALKPVLNGRQPVIVGTSNELFFLRADRFAREFGLNLIIRGSGHEYRRLNELAATGRTVILPLNFSQPPNVSTAEVAVNVTLESLLHWDMAPENPARVAAAGMDFAFTSDRLSSTRDFLKHLRKAVARGLAADAALEGLTLTPATLFGVADQLGTIEAGKLASFVIADGDVFDQKTKVVETWVAGERFEHSPRPRTDLTGMYEVQLQRKSEFAERLFVELKRDGTKFSGRASLSPVTESTAADSVSATDAAGDSAAAGNETMDVVSMKRVQLRDFTATGQFAAEKFGGKGAARMTLVFSETPSDSRKDVVALGSIVWPTGETSIASAVRISRIENTDDPDSLNDTNNNENADTPASYEVNYPLGAFGRAAPPVPAGPTAFTNATIWTCGPKGVIRKGMVLIDDGRVIGVGRTLLIPDNATIVDLQGRHITPGIIDCHSHMATDGGVNESTQAVTCEVRIGDFIDCDDISIYRQLAGGVTTSNILHGSANPIGGQNQVIKLRWGSTGETMKFADAPAGVKFALGENVKQSNWGDEYTTRYPQTRMGVQQIFRDSFQAAQEYASRMDAWQKDHRGLPPRRDLELDALREIVEGDRWIHCHSYRQDEILALIRVLNEYEITIGTFQHILEGYKVADEMAKHGAMGSAFSDWWAYKFEVYDAIPYGGALMHRAGVVVSFNSDDAELATRLNQEAAKAVKYGGVSPAEALKFVTLNPARQLRIDQHVGSLEVGKHADLVVWNGPPLSNFSRCEQTWIDGALYFDRDEDEAHRQRIAEMRNTLIQKILTSGEKMRGVGEDDDDPSAMWPRHDEFCHAHGHGHDEHEHGHSESH